MRTARNVGIIALAALAVTVLPGGGDAVEVILTALTMGFFAAMAFFVYRLHRENQMTLATLSDGRRAILFGAVGTIALLIAGSPKMFETGGGTLIWIGLLAGSLFAIFRVWVEATRYT